MELQAYEDKVDRGVTGLRDRLETFDVTAQHDIALGSHRIVWGAGVRTTNDLFLNELNPFVLDPPQKRLWIGNLFAQDSVSVSDDVTLIGGIKLEWTSFRSEVHTSELQSLMRISYAVLCLQIIIHYHI